MGMGCGGCGAPTKQTTGMVRPNDFKGGWVGGRPLNFPARGRYRAGK